MTLTSRPEMVNSGALALALASVVTGTIWYVQLMKGIWAAEALGPICRHGGMLALHCPSCHAALGLALGGTIVATVVLAPSRRRLTA